MQHDDVSTFLNHTLQSNQDLIALLETAKNSLEQLLDEIPDIMLITDGTGAVLRANQRAAEFIGFDIEMLPGHPILQTNLGHHRGEFLRIMQALCTDEHSPSNETMTRVENSDGTEEFTQWTVKCIHRTDTLADCSFLLSGTNITRLRTYEKQLEITVAATHAMVSCKEPLDVVLCTLKFLSRNRPALLNRDGRFVDCTHTDLSVFRFECRQNPGCTEEPRVTFLSVEPGDSHTTNWVEQAFACPRPHITGDHNLIIPVGLHGRQLGVLSFEDIEPSPDLLENMIFLEVLSHSMAIVLENVEAIRELEVKARLEGEFEAVETIQNRFLGRNTARNNVDIFIDFTPAERVSGDWMSYEFDEEHQILYLFVADITGHGITAAVMTGVLCGAIASARHLLRVLHNTDPAFAKGKGLEMIGNAVNDVLCQSGGRDYLATLLLGALDLKTGQVSLASAGHPPAMVVRRDTRELKGLPAPGTVLGFSQECVMGVRDVTLNPGDSLILYTDGLVENRNIYGRTLNLRKLLTNQVPTFEAIDLMKCIREHSQTLKTVDDMAVMICQWHGASDDSVT